MNSHACIAIAAVTAWRENRGGGNTGMQSVLNVIQNRATNHGTDFYFECVRPWQFSSMTATNDPQLNKWPAYNDPQFAVALDMAEQAYNGNLPDLTDGATLYYAVSMTTPPGWASSAHVKQTVEIQGQVFFRE